MFINRLLKWRESERNSALCRERKSLGLDVSSTLEQVRAKYYESRWTKDAVRDFALEHGLAGDQGMFKAALAETYVRFLLDCHDEHDKALIARVLGLALSNTSLIGALTRTSGRGAPKRGDVGARVAHAVASRLRSGGTVEHAWDSVAESQHMSESTVKSHWQRWAGPLRELMRSAVLKGHPDWSEEQIDAHLESTGYRRKSS